MGILESLLRIFNTGIVTTTILVVMLIIFIVGLVLTKKGKQVEFTTYVPTLLTTLGIFGTFLGIVLGLLDFNQNNVEESISPLLDGLKTAFITSLVGIFLSLVFKTLSSFSFLKPQPILPDPIATSDDILRAMQEQIEELTSLKEVIAGNADTTLIGQLKMLQSDINNNASVLLKNAAIQANRQNKAFEEYSENLHVKLEYFADALSRVATEQIIDVLKEVIVDFNNNLTSQFGENFKALNISVGKLVEWQNNYKHQLEQMNLQYTQGVQAIQATEISIAHISEQSQVIPAAMHDLQNIMQVNQYQITELEQHLAAFAIMREKAVESVPHIQQQVQLTIDNITAAANTASDHYKRLLTNSDQYIQSHLKISNELLERFAVETDKGLVQVNTCLIESSQRISKDVEVAINEFTQHTSKANDSLRSSSDYLQTQTEMINQHLQNTVSNLNGTMHDMAEKMIAGSNDMAITLKNANLSLINDADFIRNKILNSSELLQQRLNDVIEQAAAQQITQTRVTFESMEEQIKQQVGFTAEMVDSQLKLIDSAMQDEINRVMNEMGGALAKISGKFVEDYIKLTEAMHHIVKQQVHDE